MSNPKYRLVYFDIRALAEPIRWIFHYTGTPFVDERIPYDLPLWIREHKQKYTSTVGLIPVLYEEGQTEMGESQAISRYLAKKFGLAGDTDREDAKLDELLSMIFDLFMFWRTFAMFVRDPENNKAKHKPMLADKFALYYGKFNSVLEQSGGDFILGKKLTHVDFWLANFISIWDDPMKGDGAVMPPNCENLRQDDLYLDLTKKYPALRAHKERVTSIPQIQEWIKIRHETIV